MRKILRNIHDIGAKRRITEMNCKTSESEVFPLSKFKLEFALNEVKKIDLIIGPENKFFLNIIF